MAQQLQTSPVLIPLPPHLDPLPPLLSFGEVVDLLMFWRLGGARYARDLRAIGMLASVNEFPDGQRARYWPEDVVKFYPLRQTGGAGSD